VLAQYVSDAGAPVTLTVPMTTKSGNYYLMACADSGLVVNEFSETDNCKISSTKVTVQTPDYVISSVTNPPATSTLGGTFSFTDTTKNNGLAPATVPTVNRYYLSTDTTVGAGDILLGASRGVAALAVGALNSGTKTLTVPMSAAHGTYYVIACADYGAVITETSETNNCRASVSKVTF
jgi:subtilase family serine protease